MNRLGPTFPPKLITRWIVSYDSQHRGSQWPYRCDEPVYSMSEEADKTRQRKTQWSAHNQRIPSAGVLYRRLAAVLGGG